MELNSYPFWIIIITLISGAIAIISRPFSTYVKFVYPNAKFEAIGNKYISEKELASLVDKKNLNEFIETINSSKDYEISGENSFEVQHSLDENLIKTISMMRNDSPKKMNDFYNYLLEKIDLFLIKTALKNKLTATKVNDEIISYTNLKSTKNFLIKIIDSEKDRLKEVLKEFNFSENLIAEIEKTDFDLMVIDNEFNKFLIERLQKLKVPYKCDEAKNRYLKTLKDIYNIKNILRSKQQKYNKENVIKLFLGEGQEIAKWKFEELADADSVSHVIAGLEGTSYYNILKDNIENYNKEKSVQVLENALDKLFLKLIKDISIKNYVSIGPTLRFIVSKEYEIRNLKIIAKGISENLNSELIKPLLIMEEST